jgi:Ni/Co efflux regulator RcnB
MLKHLIPFLVAGALLPAAAHAEPGDRGLRTHEGRSESKDGSSKDRPQHVRRVEPSNSDAPRVRAEKAERSSPADRIVESPAADPTKVRRVERKEVTQPVDQVRRVERVKDRSGDVIEHGRVEPARRDGDVQVHRDRDGFSGLHDSIVKHGDKTDHHDRWSHDWRRDHRYDWRSHRSHHRSLFRLGHYYDPYGWNYRRWSIGYSLWPSYYGSNYWLNDPWQYRLPPAYGPYRWVRYYDDALLVNIYDGQVVDVIYNFFW